MEEDSPTISITTVLFIDEINDIFLPLKHSNQ